MLSGVVAKQPQWPVFFNCICLSSSIKRAVIRIPAFFFHLRTFIHYIVYLTRTPFPFIGPDFAHEGFVMRALYSNWYSKLWTLRNSGINLQHKLIRFHRIKPVESWPYITTALTRVTRVTRLPHRRCTTVWCAVEITCIIRRKWGEHKATGYARPLPSETRRLRYSDAQYRDAFTSLDIQ